MTTEGCIRAIEAVAGAIRRSRHTQPTRQRRIIHTLERVKVVTREHGTAAVNSALADISEAMLHPVDPSVIGWDVFRLFESEDSETAWTKWLAAILNPENGLELSALTWRSIVDAIIQREIEPVAVDETDLLATLKDWRAARSVPLHLGSVDRERHDVAYGRTDILIDAPSLFVIIENKLDAGWHDGAGEPQAVRYRKFGLKHRSPGQRLGLVLLTKHEDFEMDERCHDYVKIVYGDLARALRNNLRSVLHDNTSMASVLRVWPALLTVAAIEESLLGLDIDRQRRAAQGASWRSVEPLNRIRAHLRIRRNDDQA